MENDIGFLTIFLTIFIDAALAFFFGYIAKKKGYPYIAWGLIGFFIPLLYLIILLLPNRKNYKKTNNYCNNSTESSNIEINNDYNKNNESNRDIAKFALLLIIVIVIITGIVFSIYSSTEKKEDLESFKNSITDDAVEAYLYVTTNDFTTDIKDERVYIEDLYEMHINGELDDYIGYLDLANFDEMWDKYYDEIYDDYVVIVNQGKDDKYYYWQAFYYETFDEEEELSDYILNIVLDKYEEKITNNYQTDVKSETVNVKDLYNNNYITSDYFKALYEKKKELFKDDYVEIVGQGGKIYDAEYYFGDNYGNENEDTNQFQK